MGQRLPLLFFVLNQILGAEHGKVNEHPNIQASSFFSRLDEMSFHWCFLKAATRVPLTQLLLSSRLQTCRLMEARRGALPLNKISLCLWQPGLNWVPRHFYQTVCYLCLKLSFPPLFRLCLQPPLPPTRRRWNHPYMGLAKERSRAGKKEEQKVKENDIGLEREIQVQARER